MIPIGGARGCLAALLSTLRGVPLSPPQEPPVLRQRAARAQLDQEAGGGPCNALTYAVALRLAESRCRFMAHRPTVALPPPSSLLPQVDEAEARFAARGEELVFVVLDISSTHYIDSDTIQLLKARLFGRQSRAWRVWGCG